jgi:penicillin-binding protein 1A
MGRNKKPRNNRSRARSSAPQSKSILRRLIKWAFVLGLWCVLILGFTMAWFAKDLPNLIDNPRFERKISITVLANDGSLIARYGDIKEGNISATDLPKNVTNAILATEDRRFYYHYGLDPIGLARAVFINLTNKAAIKADQQSLNNWPKSFFIARKNL